MLIRSRLVKTERITRCSVLAVGYLDMHTIVSKKLGQFVKKPGPGAFERKRPRNYDSKIYYKLTVISIPYNDKMIVVSVNWVGLTTNLQLILDH